MNLNHMNKPTVFECRNCGERIYKNKKQYHEDYQCERRTGKKLKYKEKYPEEEVMRSIRNPQHESYYGQEQNYKKYQKPYSYQRNDSNYSPKQNLNKNYYPEQEPYQNQALLKQPQMIKNGSMQLTGQQRSKRFCEQLQKRWNIQEQQTQQEYLYKQQQQQPQQQYQEKQSTQQEYQYKQEASNKKKNNKKNKNKKQNKKQNSKQQERKDGEQSIKDVKIQCEDCHQMVSIKEMELHFSDCDYLVECEFCGMLVSVKSLGRHHRKCQVKNYQQEQKEDQAYNRVHNGENNNRVNNQEYNNRYNQFPNQDHNNEHNYQQAVPYYQNRPPPHQQQQQDDDNKQIAQFVKKQIIDNLICVKYRKSSPGQKNQNRDEKQQQDSCSICYYEYRENEALVKLPCLHDYHRECIKGWLEYSTSCPLCKANLGDFIK